MGLQWSLVFEYPPGDILLAIERESLACLYTLIHCVHWDTQTCDTSNSMDT